MLKIIILLLICTWWGSVVSGSVVKREERTTVVSTEYGEISAVRVADDDTINGSYLLHFFTLDPNSLFLPVLLHADMVFYVHTGSGKLSWTDEDELKTADLRRGDVYRLREGSVFFVQSNLDTEAERQKLRIHAIFSSSKIGLRYEPAIVPYSSIRDMLLGFDRKVLQAAFMVPEAEIEELLNGEKPAAIIHRVSETKKTALQMEARLVGSLVGRTVYNILESSTNKKSKKGSLFNLFKEDKDFENCNGWSTAVTRKKLSALKGTDIGVFMVNLTAGSMMGPHWNPMATEIAVVLQGQGMVRVVCSKETGGCNDARYEVEEGDVFVVPRFHAMAQMAFNNQTLVFMGFSTSAKKNHPQFLAGQASVLRTLDRDVVALSFNVTNTTAERVLASQGDSVILGCVSCAEEELRVMEEEREREAARKREEEEAARQEEERKRREEEEEARKKEEEEAARQEEERKRREEEEEAARQEEERKRREEEEEAARKREEEEAAQQEKEREEEEAARKREEEEAAQQEKERERREEEEEARKREEEEAARQEEERKRREEEEAAAARKREEEEAARQEEERKRREEEEEARKREEEAAARQEEERRRREEEAAKEEARKKEEEEARRQEEERKRREEQEEEETRRREEEEAAARREEEARRAREEEEEREREAREREEEAAAREERERIRREEEEEEARRREEEEGQRKETGRRQHGGGSEEERAAEAERRREEAAQGEEEEATRRERRREPWQEGGEGDEEEQ